VESGKGRRELILEHFQRSQYVSRNIDLSQTTLLAQNEEGEQSTTAHTVATITH
jgi:hypothetical protein